MLDISNFPWAECTLSENRVMYQDDSVSLKRNKRDTGVMRYEFELVTIDMDTNVGRRMMAKLSAHASDVLSFIHPRLSYTMGTEPASGINVALASAPAGAKEVEFYSAEPWQLFCGDYIQFVDQSKVYQVAEDTALQAGSQIVKLTNELRLSPTGDSRVIVNDVTWYLEPNGVIEASMDASDGQDIELTLQAVESL